MPVQVTMIWHDGRHEDYNALAVAWTRTVLSALYYERFGWHTAAEYEAFCQAYGVDVMAWQGYRVLADVRELLMVTWLAQKAGESPRLAVEASKRVAALRDGGSRRDWDPF